MKKINPRVINYILTFFIAIIASAFMLTSYSILTKKVVASMEASYREAADLIVEGYAKLGDQMMNYYRTTLDTIYDKKTFENGTSEQIQEYLNKNQDKSPEEFFDFFYVDRAGTAWSMDGSKTAVGDREYYKATVIEGLDYYVSPATTSRISGIPVFMVMKSVRDKDGNVKGALGGTVRLSAIKHQFSSVSVMGSGNIAILDQRGNFVVHRNKSYIFKSYAPPSGPFEKLTTSAIVEQVSGDQMSIDSTGHLVQILYRRINDTGWSVCVIVPMTERLESLQREKIAKILITIACVLFAFIMFFGELKLIDYCQRKEYLFSNYDAITKLWSREKFEVEAQKIIKKRGNSKFMLIEADVIGFKFINQNYGEAEANKVLRILAKNVARISSHYHGICCRGYADHFYCFYKISSVRAAMDAFEDYLSTCATYYATNKTTFRVKYGIAFMLPEEKYRGLTIHGLIGQASAAKSFIKRNTDSSYCIYDSKILKKIQEEQFLEKQSEKALLNHEFFVVYQPKIDLKTDKIVGAEALVRWRNPERGIISPGEFIPLFERNGFVEKLDYYVYDEVFRFLDDRIKKGLPIVKISVNMSRAHNKPEVFIRDFLEIFHRYNVPPEYVQVEILESSIGDNHVLIDITDRLHKEGFTVAMDDFGSGESSLNMLTKVSIDVLKFDRVFLLSATDKHGNIDRRSAGFIESLVSLSKCLDKETLFEGVETEAQRDFLRVINCDQVQGFFYSKPLEEDKFVKFIDENI